MATFTFEEQRVIIQFLHLSGMKPIEIHQQLNETCNYGIMDVKNMRSWVQQFKEDWMLCENKPKEPRPHTSRSEDMIARVEQMVMECCRLTVKQIAGNASISVGSVDTILHDDLKMPKVSARWVLRVLTDKKRFHPSQCVRQCYHVTKVWIVLSFHQLSQWVRHRCRCSILKPNGNWLNGSTPTHRHRRNFGLPPVLRKWW